MLQTLRIKNLALIEDLTWELDGGLNILSGETGAGKSILIDAFNLLLGERADQSLIRDGASECSVEGILSVGKEVDDLLRDLGLEPGDDGELLLKRSFNTQKQNRQFINGSPTTLQVLKKIGDILVDLHGPHDHQSLLSQENQLKALDAYAGLDKDLVDYRASYREVLQLEEEIAALESHDSGSLEQELDFLEHQINEIEAAKLSPGDEETIEQDYKIAVNAKRLIELASAVSGILSESDENVLNQLARVQRTLKEWEAIDPGMAELVGTHEGIISQLQDFEREIVDRAEKIDLDAEQLSLLEEKMNLLQHLKRKYGPTVQDILDRCVELKSKRDALSGREESLAELRRKLDQALSQRGSAGKKLTDARKKALPKLGKEVSTQLRELGFKQSEFRADLQTGKDARNSGFDEVEFQFAPNPGESARALRAIASSGEMARVMLAIKSVLAEKDRIPVLIFDEVDANVGGETALAVGKRLRQLARKHQVLCITHLPQVAAAGHQHFRVEKKVQKGRTLTQLDMLEPEERVGELARMFGDHGNTAKELAGSLLKQFQSQE